MDSDKVMGMLYGVAIGDALGAPFEFRNTSPKPLWNGLIAETTHTVRFQYSSMQLLPGCVTDDTEMTLALLFSILQARGWDRSSVISSYLEWANSKPVGLGTNTRALMQGVKTLRGFQRRWDGVQDWPDRQSNGTLMRATPLALLPAQDWMSASDRDVALTNNNETNRLCNRIYVSTLRCLVWNEPLELECDWLGPDPVLQAVQDALYGTVRPISDKRVKGWVITALYVALYTMFQGLDYQASMQEIATQFLGVGSDGKPTRVIDCDTVMAITGGLVGARVGLRAMMLESDTAINIQRVQHYFDTTPRQYKITPSLQSRIQQL